MLIVAHYFGDTRRSTLVFCKAFIIAIMQASTKDHVVQTITRADHAAFTRFPWLPPSSSDVHERLYNGLWPLIYQVLTIITIIPCHVTLPLVCDHSYAETPLNISFCADQYLWFTTDGVLTQLSCSDKLYVRSIFQVLATKVSCTDAAQLLDSEPPSHAAQDLSNAGHAQISRARSSSSTGILPSRRR